MAVNFDGNNDVITVTNTTLGMSGTTPLSISAWINYGGTIGDIMGQSTEISLRVTGTSRLQFILNAFSSNDRVTSGGSAITAGWQHVCGVYNGTTMEIFRNGSSLNSVTPSGTYNNTSGTWGLGRHIGGSTGFDGDITEVAVWDVGLNASDIALLANSRIKGTPLQIQPSNLQAYFPLNDVANGQDGDSQTFVDQSGNGNNGTGSDGSGGGGGLLGAAETFVSYSPAQAYVVEETGVAPPTTGIMTLNTGHWGGV